MAAFMENLSLLQIWLNTNNKMPKTNFDLEGDNHFQNVISLSKSIFSIS